jgi:hypothetical protein
MDLISSIQKLSDKEILTANHFIVTMRYPKGPNEGKLISPYLQNKAYEYVSQNLYKHKVSVTSIQETNNKMETNFNKMITLFVIHNRLVLMPVIFRIRNQSIYLKFDL